MKVDEAMKMLEDGVRSVFESENYNESLIVMSRLTDYSAANCILIFAQRPEATYVAGYRDWQRKFNRNVQKGAKSIRIIAPMKTKDENDEERIRFRVVSVFDVADTEGDPLPSFGVDELKGDVSGYEHFMDVLKAISPIPMRFEEIRCGAKGYFSRSEPAIAIQNGMSEVQTVKTFLHEICHAKLHADDREKDRRTKEIEAEGTCSVVCSYFGIETDAYSHSYIVSWSSSKETRELKSSLETIRRTAKELIADMTGKMEGIT